MCRAAKALSDRCSRTPELITCLETIGKKGSVSLSKEKVFAQAHDADFWIVRSGANVDLTYDGMRKDNEIYARFKPWKTHKVFACNTMKVPFFDEEPFRPDFMLCDLVMILHPELSEGYEPRYFRAIK